MYKTFLNFKNQGIIINEIITNAYTEKGERLAKKFRFEYLRDHKQYGKIYKIKFENLLKMFENY